MLNKRNYFIHFTRVFFTGFAIGICSLSVHLWNVHQPVVLTFQWQQCQSSLANQLVTHMNIFDWFRHFHWSDLLPSFPFFSTVISTPCHSYLKYVYSINVIECLNWFRSSLCIYFIYHFVRLGLFHREQIKRNFYAHLYREDQKNIERKSRCFNRLLLR